MRVHVRLRRIQRYRVHSRVAARILQQVAANGNGGPVHGMLATVGYIWCCAVQVHGGHRGGGQLVHGV